MTDATRRRMFEPFFTTKESTGTGLGLWVGMEIIVKHNATIRVSSRAAEVGGEKRSGTVFMLFFPDAGIGLPPAAIVAAGVQEI